MSAASASADAAGTTAEIAELPNLDLDELGVRWRKLLRTPPPDHLPHNLFMRLLAYSIQARRFVSSRQRSSSAAVAGTLPHGAGLSRLGDLPMQWQAQMKQVTL